MEQYRIEELAERIVIKARVINIDARDFSQSESRFTESRKRTRFDHELTGMTQAMKVLGIECEFEWDSEVVEMTAVIINGKRYEI